jgi:acylphosphatase
LGTRYSGVKPFSTSTDKVDFFKSRTCPIEALTIYPFPRKFPTVRAFAGDSTITSLCPIPWFQFAPFLEPFNFLEFVYIFWGNLKSSEPVKSICYKNALMGSLMTKATIIVEGWVQGVGYRTFVKQVAVQEGLKGLVRDLSGGKVEIFCEGEPAKITAFLTKINYKGEKGDPLSAYVENLAVYMEGETGYAGPWRDFTDFQIDYGFEIKSPVDQAMLENLESGKIYVAATNVKLSQLTQEFTSFRQETNSNF